jgi:hypothetical protein
MTVRRLVGRAALACLVAGILFSVGLGVPSADRGSPPVLDLKTPPLCPGAAAADAPNGTLSIEGGRLAPNATAGQTVEYTFHLSYVLYRSASGAVLASGCERTTSNATTGPTGAFAFSSVLPPTDCPPGVGICLSFGGVFGPTKLDADLAPAGYALSVTGGPTDFSLALVDDLSTVVLSPGGATLTVSPGAPSTFTALGRMANGSATPLAPSFSWTLNGSGWSFDGTPSGPSATIVATPGAGLGSLGVQASANASGIDLAPPPATTTLYEQPTAIETAGLDRTTIDVGSTISVHLLAVGAAGYPYSALVDPGLGLPAVVPGCEVTASPGGTANISCAANLTYPNAGIAQPTARLTNGYSSSAWQFPDVTVDPAPELSVDPAAPVGYAGGPVPIELVAAAGSGAPPYARACLEVGPGPATCLATPGPTWEFEPTIVAVGRYDARAWAIDAEGENASASFAVTVVPPLDVSPIDVGAVNASAGVALPLSASISGGELPVRFWWNASDVGGSILAGSSSSDGSLGVEFVPPAAASVTISLTVIDSLGTFEEVDRLITVGAEPAVTIVAVEPPPAGPVVAGMPFAVAWEAVDRSGALVRSFTSTATVDLSRGGLPAAGWVNASGLGPLSPLGNGSFGIPAWGWVGGVLELSITVTGAGILTVGLGGAGLPGVVGPLAVDISPDRAHLRVFDPRVVAGGGRENSTFWQVSDRFGNPAAGALVTIRLRWSSASRTTLVAAIEEPNGSSGVWVNFSAPGPGSANVTVLDSAGDVLLGPLAIPALPLPPSVSPATVTLAAAVPVGALGAAWSGIVQRRARRRAAARSDEESMLRLAEGRSQAVELVRRAGAADLAEIEVAWSPGPAPSDLAEWLASLVADGTLGATVGRDGRARFCLADGRPADPHVIVDAEEFDRGLQRREAERKDADAPDDA